MDDPPGARFPIPRAWRKSIAKETRQRLHASLCRLSPGPIPLRADGFGGIFEIEPRSDLFTRIWFDGDYEPELRRLMLEHVDPARDVVDVGANVGLFSVFFARHARRVLAIEPTPHAHELLRRNLARNGCDSRVVAERKAAMSAAGTVPMETMPGREEYSTTGRLRHGATSGGDHRRIEVEAATLDSLVAAHGIDPGFIKIDVEGGEASVLAGASEILARHRPVVLAEFSPPLLQACGSSPAEVLGIFRDHRYRVSDPAGGEPGAREYGDLLAIPEP